ncbi:hypothetical protein A2U01_0050513, partial [Trifolium medium]|nr:hypothetical protein [Trifolium medium]
KDSDKAKWPTKVSASARRKKTAENPPKKRARKRPAQAEAYETDHPMPEHHEAVETAHPMPEHHEGDATQAEHHQTDITEEGHSGDDGDDIVCDMEEEEMEREGDEGQAKVRRPAWVNPYEGKA